MISFIIPTRNNLPYLKLAYKSVRYWNPDEEIIILDDNSADGTKEWLLELKDKDKNIKVNTHEGKQVGHTVLYDEGVKIASNDIFTIFHADMVCAPKYAENLLKHLKRGTVVSATRIEPPLHPKGKEKITQDWGTYPEDLDDGIYNETGGCKLGKFYKFCSDEQKKNEGKTSKGIFAPWAMYKDDFLAIGGHDKLFSPFPYEDSDIFQRMILKGYNIIQSWESFVYHFTCRGHRWTKEVQKDDVFYKLCCTKNAAHFIRKWGHWIQNDENSYPIIHKKYDIGVDVTNCWEGILQHIEPWFSTVYVDCPIGNYIKTIQPGTPFKMTKRVKHKTVYVPNNDIVISFDGSQLNNERLFILSTLPKMIEDSGEVGVMEYDIFTITINRLEDKTPFLVNNDSEYYTNQLIKIPEKDIYYTAELFNVFEKIKEHE